MSEIIVLLFLVIVEVGYCAYGMITGKATKELKNRINIGAMLLTFLLMLSGIMPFGFRWSCLILILGIRGIISLISMTGLRAAKSKEIELEREETGKKYGKGKLIRRCILNLLLIGFACTPAFIFADYKEIPTDGPHTYDTLSYFLLFKLVYNICQISLHNL